MGGVKDVLIATADSVTAVTVASDKISAISMASSAKFYRYAFRPGAASMTSTRTLDPANGINYVETLLTLSFPKMETSKRVEIEALAQSDLVAIVRDNNDKYFFLGKDEPVIMTANAGQTGTARSDKNGYDVTLADESKALPYEILTGEGGVDIESLL